MAQGIIKSKTKMQPVCKDIHSYWGQSRKLAYCRCIELCTDII